MGLLQIFVHFIGLVLNTYVQAGMIAVDTVEEGFRSPLAHVGLDGAMQTFMVALIPVLTIVATIKLLQGPIRMMVVLSMLGALFHITWPLVDGIVTIV